MVGVSIHHSFKLWRARKRLGSSCEHLGYHASDVAASLAYRQGSFKNKVRNVIKTDIEMMKILTDAPCICSKVVQVVDIKYQQVVYDCRKHDMRYGPHLYPFSFGVILLVCFY